MEVSKQFLPTASALRKSEESDYKSLAEVKIVAIFCLINLLVLNLSVFKHQY